MPNILDEKDLFVVDFIARLIAQDFLDRIIESNCLALNSGSSEGGIESLLDCCQSCLSGSATRTRLKANSAFIILFSVAKYPQCNFTTAYTLLLHLNGL